MKCKNIQDLLSLEAFGDLSDKEVQTVHAHLRICKKCQDHLEAYQYQNVLISRIRASSPKDPQRVKHLENIAEQVRAKNAGKYKRPDFKKNTLLNSGLPKILNLAAAFLIALFVYQQIEIKRSIQLLEKQLEQQKMSSESASTSDFHNLSLQEHLNSAGLSESSKKGNKPEDIQYLERENTMLKKYLKKNYPEIYKEYQQRRANEKSEIQL